MEFLSYFINGISLGSVYAIIALGYTMVYGIAKMLNFAHGDVIMSRLLCDVSYYERAGLASSCGSASCSCCLYGARRPD